MSEISRSALFGKLNSLGYKAIEAATVFCKMRGNPYVELVHWIHQILQLQDSDLHRIVKQFNIDPSRLVTDLTEALDRCQREAFSLRVVLMPSQDLIAALVGGGDHFAILCPAPELVLGVLHPDRLGDLVVLGDVLADERQVARDVLVVEEIEADLADLATIRRRVQNLVANQDGLVAV